MSKKHRCERHSDRQRMKQSVDRYLKTQQFDIAQTTGVCYITYCKHNDANVCTSLESRCSYKDDER